MQPTNDCVAASLFLFSHCVMQVPVNDGHACTHLRKLLQVVSPRHAFVCAPQLDCAHVVHATAASAGGGPESTGGGAVHGALLVTTPSQFLSWPPQSAPEGVQRQSFPVVVWLQYQPETQSPALLHVVVQRPPEQCALLHCAFEVHGVPTSPAGGGLGPVSVGGSSVSGWPGEVSAPIGVPSGTTGV